MGSSRQALFTLMAIACLGVMGCDSSSGPGTEGGGDATASTDARGTADANASDRAMPDAQGMSDAQGMPDARVMTDAATPVDGGTPAPDGGTPPTNQRKNILLLISDDLGLDATACYGVGQDVAPTPNIQALCDRGVVFRNAWVNPFCSATRATMLTGRYGFRTGVGRVAPPGVQADEFTLPRALSANPDLGYAHASVGKWHLGNSRPGSNTHPNEMGWGHFSGLIRGVLPDFFSFTKVVDGREVEVNRYATTDTVDDAIMWLTDQEGPWFLWVAFNAPHSPFHIPPAHLHSNPGLSDDPRTMRTQPLPYYKAAIEAMDTEIGRLFDAIGPEAMANTHVIYLGDNGTPGQVVQPPFSSRRAKGSIYNGGIHVPFIVAGPAVANPGREVDALINGVDVYSTVLELAGVDVEATVPPMVIQDSVSIVPYLTDPDATPRRQWIMSELFTEQVSNGEGQTIRDDRYKLIRFRSGDESFYDLSVDPYEAVDLLDDELSPEAQMAYDALNANLDTLLATEP